MMMLRWIGLACLASACVGCAATDPYQRPGVWQPSGSVQGNLAAMVADPRDLLRGHGSAAASPHEASLAVENLWEGHAKPFIGTQVVAGGPADAPPPAAPPAPPAPASGGN